MTALNSLTLLALTVTAFAVSWSVAAFVVKFAQRANLVDYPNHRSLHGDPTPRGGGIGIVLATIGGLILAGFIGASIPSQAIWLVGLVGGTIAIVSFIDDVTNLSPLVRLSIHVVAAVAVIIILEPIDNLTIAGVGRNLEVFAQVLIVVWIVGMTNAFNFMDGIDGIAATQATVAGAYWVAFGLFLGAPAVAVIGVLLVGSSCGFLVHNWPPARLFMGDVGSAFLGFVFATLPLLAAEDDPVLSVMGAFLLWPFIFDTTMTFIRRLARGENVITAHRSHLYQRLVATGLSHKHVTYLYLVLAAAAGFASLALKAQLSRGYIVLFVCAAGIGFLLLWLVTSRELKTVESVPLSSITVKTMLGWLLRHRRPLVVAFHLGLIALSAYVSLLVRFDGDVPDVYWYAWVQALPLLMIMRGASFGFLRLYQGLWRYTGIWDLRDIVVAVASSSVCFYLVAHWGFGWTSYPRSVVLIVSVFLIVLTSGVRLTRRFINELQSGETIRNVIIYGAGDAGEMLVRDIRTNSHRRYRAIGFVDDDPAKVHQRIHSVPVLGTRADLPKIIARWRPDEILLAIPGSSAAAVRSIVRAVDGFNVSIKTIPTLQDILDNRVEISRVRNLSVQDLLSRGPIGLDPEPIRRFLKGRRVMVTGAGGSIGSELCRQIIGFDAEALILFERHENSLYHIVNDLTDRSSAVRLHPVIGDVTDGNRVAEVLRDLRPEIIFHAAAHKHVPLMEENPCEAVKNNVGGTRLLMEAAQAHGVDRFILISTDKAVNPSSVMGATKRVAELMLLTEGSGSGTCFMTVRFGNVLASAGSVVPRFLQQIKAGGPVTVTHPEIRRYFMLIPEAVQLVLHAAARGEGGKLYALEMGEQIKLVDMARDLIRLSGFVPDSEIPIKYIGLRPGEKLYEELVGPDEVAEATHNNVMRVVPLALPDRDTRAAEQRLLEAAAQCGDVAKVLQCLARLAPGLEFALSAPQSAQSIEQPSGAMIATAGITPSIFEYTCPHCNSQRVHRSHARSRVEEWRKTISGKRPYRCFECNWRGWLVPLELKGVERAPLEDHSSPDLGAIDNLIKASVEARRSVFTPRDLPTL